MDKFRTSELHKYARQINGAPTGRRTILPKTTATPKQWNAYFKQYLQTKPNSAIYVTILNSDGTWLPLGGGGVSYETYRHDKDPLHLESPEDLSDYWGKNIKITGVAANMYIMQKPKNVGGCKSKLTNLGSTKIRSWQSLSL